MFKKIKAYRTMKRLKLQSEAVIYGTIAEFIEGKERYLTMLTRLASLQNDEEFKEALQKEVLPILAELFHNDNLSKQKE